MRGLLFVLQVGSAVPVDVLKMEQISDVKHVAILRLPFEFITSDFSVCMLCMYVYIVSVVFV